MIISSLFGPIFCCCCCCCCFFFFLVSDVVTSFELEAWVPRLCLTRLRDAACLLEDIACGAYQRGAPQPRQIIEAVLGAIPCCFYRLYHMLQARSLSAAVKPYSSWSISSMLGSLTRSTSNLSKLGSPATSDHGSITSRSHHKLQAQSSSAAVKLCGAWPLSKLGSPTKEVR